MECYVLDDAQKTAVMSQRGFGGALGMSGGKALPRFLATKAISEILGAELSGKFAQPLKFQWGVGGAERLPGISYGYDAALLIDLCRAIVQAEADGKIGDRHKRIIAQAHIIFNASAKAGIKGLVYALAGYNIPSSTERWPKLATLLKTQSWLTPNVTTVVRRLKIILNARCLTCLRSFAFGAAKLRGQVRSQVQLGNEER